MRLEDLNWMDVESWLKRDDRIMLICGATEQHGYLSLTTDVRIPLALADAASELSGVPVAPAIAFGCSPYFLSYPGTISLRVSTLLDVVEDVVSSLYSQGFRRILILNGHDGNQPVKLCLNEIANRLEGIHLDWYTWWESHSVEEFAREIELKPYHAGWLEAFPFCKVSELPPGQKLPPQRRDILNAAEARALFGDGVMGGDYETSPENMDRLFQICLSEVLARLEF